MAPDTAAALSWRVADDEPFEGGQSGGDAQVGDDVSVRLVPTSEPNDGLHGLITETWFVQDLRYLRSNPPDESVTPTYGVMCRIEYLVCRDVTNPGGTEVRSNYEYDDQADVMIYESEEGARAALLRAIKRSMALASAYQWDGRT